MHRRTLRPVALTAAAVLAATAALAMPSPGEQESPPLKRVEVHRIAGPGHVAITSGDGNAFFWRGTMLGVAFVPLTPELRKHFGAPEDAGVLVSKVVADSAAQAAGVEVGDILTRVDGKPVREGFELAELIRSRKAGETVALEVLRDGRSQSLNATLKESEAPAMFERKAIFTRCVDQEGNEKECPAAALADVDCGDDGKCEVKVICKDGSCDCTINGEDKPCPEGLGKGDGQ